MTIEKLKEALEKIPPVGMINRARRRQIMEMIAKLERDEA